MIVFTKLQLITVYISILLYNGMCYPERHAEVKKICSALETLFDASEVYQILLIQHERENINFLKTVHPLLQCSISKQVVVLMQTSFNISRLINSEHLLFYNARYNTQFLSILSSIDEEGTITRQFYDTLEFIIKLSPSTSRPRCLFIMDKNERISMDMKNNLLLYAWKKKFLDVSILEISPLNNWQNKSVVDFYNPFTNVYSSRSLTQRLEIFPNKLENMKQYPLKISLVLRPPAVNFDRNTSGDPITINGSDYGCLQYYSERMNFSIHLTTPRVLGYDEPLVEHDNLTLLELIEQDDVNLSGNQVFLHFHSIMDKKQIGYQSVVSYFDDLIIMVPVYPAPLWHIQFTIITIFLNSTVHVCIMFISARLCRFNKRYWLPHRILQMLYGISSSKVPSKISERIFFLTLVLISLRYSTIMYATLAGIRLTDRDEGPFNTLEDIKNSDLVIETRDVYADVLASSADEDLKQILQKTKFVNDIMNCPERAFKSRKIACLMDKLIAVENIEKNQNSPHKMKIMDYVLLRAPKGLLFSEASPFAPEFNRLLIHVRESGIWWRWYVPDKNHKLCSYSNTDMIFSPDPLLKNKLLTIWLSGCIISITAFVSEVIVDCYQKDGYTNERRLESHSD